MKRFLQIGIIVLSGFMLAGCGGNPDEDYQITLEVWGTFDDTDAYQEIFRQYKEINPHIRAINYRKLPTETYRQDLLDALASGNGPDIFLVRNSWMGDFADKMVPVPQGMIPEKNYREAFVDVAANDFINGSGEIYGVPVSVDSLALYYNKDIFNANGIARPPATWEEVAQLVPRLTQIDNFGTITQSAIAMGTAPNVNRPTDILTALLYQKGSGLTKDTGKPDLTDQASREAVEFYMQFSDIRSPLYTWNPNLHYSLDSFYEGTLAMMINYSWQYPTLKQKNAKLNIGIAPLPQFAGTTSPANQANYWGYGVAKNKSYPETDTNVVRSISKEGYATARAFESWQFLKFFAFSREGEKLQFQNAINQESADLVMPIDASRTYLEKTMKPAARRDIIADQQNDTVLAPFASGNLIAKNWFQGNVDAVEGVLVELINNLYSGSASLTEALTVATRRITTLTQDR